MPSKKGNIPRNIRKKLSEEHKRKIGDAQRGDKAPNWRGGKKQKRGGYISIKKPKHPFCDSQGYVSEHRLVIEKMIGRYLKPQETSHHLGKPNDNRPYMLMAFVNDSAHQRFAKNPDNVKLEEIIFDGRKVVYI